MYIPDDIIMHLTLIVLWSILLLVLEEHQLGKVFADPIAGDLFCIPRSEHRTAFFAGQNLSLFIALTHRSRSSGLLCGNLSKLMQHA